MRNDRAGGSGEGPVDGGTGAGGAADRDAAEDLRATVDSIRTDIGRLARVEDEKRARDPADPELDRLSDEAVGLADRIRRETLLERQLTDEIG